ncbi:hypothetical protein PRZ48_014245 [Zasmidium cellare]|uniref:F-box domain-containing protein n=1 Tax=Zasmidium cellare TaxID=395010 RepID=A0ABR0E0F0_ZASCE|nr:hypothetical protein PRZ48_014245 [Zasmidium cellare]
MADEDSDSEMKVSAATRALNTVELLEAILLDDGVDMKTLLLSQRVSTTWKNIIKESIKLQEKLWFRRTHKKSQKKGYLLNPLLFHHHDVVWRFPNGTAHELHFSRQKTVFCKVFGYFSGACEVRFWDNGVLDHLPSGSWQHMVITQHRRKRLDVEIVGYDDNGRASLKSFSFRATATIGLLVERVKEALKSPFEEF